MRKCITIGLLTCAFASTAIAAESGVKTFRVGAHVDYTWVAMAQVNKQMNKGANVTNLNSGIGGMLDLDMALAPFLLVGARAGFLYFPSARTSYNYVLYNQKTTINTSLIPLEAGLIVKLELPATPISIMAGVYVGYGFAFASFKNDIDAIGQTATFTQPFNGGGFIGELPAEVNFKLSSVVSLNIIAGYRYAKIAKMLQSEDVRYNGIPGISIPVGAKNDILKDSDNNNLAFDFSGVNIGAGLSLSF